ncbi:putative restriction endonuclease [Calidithermus terrae]|uniref:Putative restriction endonuclease n=1 Tax=Calidithermus terrae TaxID=1408545 RepID=A0A399F257_9DEIN|nr:Uma2 family endonuclease [Calidithermus terrae]RIH88922.1 putative restriction endonuclease [Calidithermus terrae]
MSVHVKKAEPGGDEGRPQAKTAGHSSWLDEHTPPGAQNGEIAAELASRLHAWARQGQHGRVGLNSGFVLRRDPDRVRGPDIWFVQRERVPKEGVPQGFWEIAPDLAVEVVAPTATVDEIKERLEDYFAAGTRLVWLVYPRFRQVEAYSPEGSMKTFREGDTLEAPLVLPGFGCRVAELFSA